MAEPSAIELRIVRGNPTDEEIAALTAVLSVAVAEQAARIADSVPTPLIPSAWERTRRNLRTGISTGPGHWRGFSG
ncbi:acyl-CoA carboxylase subunit epsilon [Plantibacter flavus]